MLAPDVWVPLAEVSRPHGVRGELRLRPFNQDSDLLFELTDVFVRPSGDGASTNGRNRSAGKVMRVEGIRRANEAILLKLATVDDRDGADELRGAHVCARRGEFPPLEEGEFYACDIEGARVVVGEPGEGAAPRELGHVIELRSYPSVDVLVVAAADGGRPWEVPLVDEIVKLVDAEGGIVVLASLEGVERE